MPVYVYRVGDSPERLEVRHSMKDEPKTWSDLCKLDSLDSDLFPADTPVERMILPVRSNVTRFTSDLKNGGFRKLERRDSGVYEDVTAPKGERIVDANSV